MTSHILTIGQHEQVQRKLELLPLQILIASLVAVAFSVVFFGGLGFLIGIPVNEIGALFRDFVGPVVLMDLKMLAIVGAVAVVWFLISYDKVEIFACYASDNIFSHVPELIRLWSSLWSRLSALVHLFASTPITWTIQSAWVVSPQTRHIPGLSPQLE